jgi:hypothetical protein
MSSLYGIFATESYFFFSLRMITAQAMLWRGESEKQLDAASILLA